ncbi:hypothetical protein [Kiloniella laminariae]|uniref:hypothetical protein n=1 Tax=Kiloniella laminariae TaxID=454162 RepID=UPI0003822E2C|nr:hypothetical protein [Kiloniella laminariae]
MCKWNKFGRKIDRLAVRALAEKNSAELREFNNTGGNIYQKSLEHSDAIKEIASEMSEKDAIDFYNTYAEEIEACTKKTLDDVQALNTENEIWTQVIGVIIAVVMGIVFFAVIFK